MRLNLLRPRGSISKSFSVVKNCLFFTTELRLSQLQVEGAPPSRLDTVWGKSFSSYCISCGFSSVVLRACCETHHPAIPRLDVRYFLSSTLNMWCSLTSWWPAESLSFLACSIYIYISIYVLYINGHTPLQGHQAKWLKHRYLRCFWHFSLKNSQFLAFSSICSKTP